MEWQDRARRQSGAISRAQLVRCGLSHGRIDGLVARRELTEMLPGVYSPRPVPESTLQRLWAGALWSGGIVSHGSAAALWKIPTTRTTITHVTVDDRKYRHPVPGVRTHRVPLGRLHRTTFDGLPITDRARTVIDLLRTEPFAAAATLLDRAIQQGWISELDLDHEIESSKGRTGNRQLKILRSDIEPGAHAESERRLHRLLRRAGITGWVAQYEVRTSTGFRYVDVAFPEQRVALEVEGRRAHDDGSDRFDDDRVRHNDLVASGWRVIRVTWSMLTKHPDELLARIAQVLAA